jgi:hypothetical protein
MARSKPETAQAAARVLRSILEALPSSAAVAAYLRGYADGLERRRRPPTEEGDTAGRADRVKK